MTNSQYNKTLMGICQTLGWGIACATDDVNIVFDIIDNMADLRYKTKKYKYDFMRLAFSQIDNGIITNKCLIKMVKKYSSYYGEERSKKMIANYERCLKIWQRPPKIS